MRGCCACRSTARPTRRKLKSLLTQYAGGQCHVAIRYRNAQGECDIRLPESCRVKVSAPLLDSLAQWLDEKNVEVVY